MTEACSQAVTVSAPRIDAVLNAATFVNGPVWPGEMVALFGSNLTGNITFDGIPAIVLFVSSSQVNVTVPYTVTSCTTKLEMGAASLQVAVDASSPGIFAAVSSGPGLVTLYATGGGSLSSDSLPTFTLPVSVMVNGQLAQVLYAGIAPGLPSGANQINIRVPSGVSAGALSIVLNVGSANSKAFVYTP